MRCWQLNERSLVRNHRPRAAERVYTSKKYEQTQSEYSSLSGVLFEGVLYTLFEYVIYLNGYIKKRRAFIRDKISLISEIFSSSVHVVV